MELWQLYQVTPDSHQMVMSSPDFIENNVSLNTKAPQPHFEDTEKANQPSTFSSKYYTSTPQNNKEEYLERPKPSNLILCHSVSTSNTDLRPKMYDSTEDLKCASLTSEPTNLHTRSQSLIDMAPHFLSRNIQDGIQL
ncbi:hypothetical protein NQ317_009912 [Molorchus minor]|uniref:Uncharacterized protein n=1 Tax=Molorchus minor TaxID=1323400 RepID=A0ABQ9K6G6_9CUCU|nr:hypothetical protein NQ317_009912 [Molorchus minor]